MGLERNTEQKPSKVRGADTMCNIVESGLLFSGSRDTRPLEVTSEVCGPVFAILVHQ